MTQRRFGSPAPSVRFSIWYAILSGALLGLAFPPVDMKGLAWVGLVPLLLAMTSQTAPRRVFLLGYLAGLVFFLIVLHPLVSVHSWTGWIAESSELFAHRMNRQWLFMQGIWLAFSCWSALFWGVWAMLTQRLTGDRPWRLLIVAPSAWVLLPEWARSQTTFGFTWAFLGNATADLAPIRQLAALGGVWPLSLLVVAVNIGVLELLQRRVRFGWQRRASVVCAIAVSAWVGGALYLGASPTTAGDIQTAVVQFQKPSYTIQDFSETGLDRNYFLFIRQALTHQPRLIVLPESIAVGATSLDGTPSRAKPPEFQIPRSRWEAQMAHVLAGTPTVLVIGLDTIEQGEDHNTLVAWTAQETLGWYHKRRLVPFSEYQPWGWGPLALRGRSQYFPGRSSQLIKAPGMILGGFICQEVLVPWVTRSSVRDGATILVTGGNDGVFSDPAVALVHADAAQLRAVETGRYIVRAMKSGISAIIDPHGRELVRSRSAEPAVLVHEVHAQEGLTPYVRFGDWVVWSSALAVAGLAAVTLKP